MSEDEGKGTDPAENRAFLGVLPGANDTSHMMDGPGGLLGPPPHNVARPSRPKDLSKRNRTVSWEQHQQQQQPPNLAAQNLPKIVKARTYSQDSQVSGLSRNKLSLKDIQRAHPHEDEADAYIQRTLDEVDPTLDVDISEAQQSLLGSVPDQHRFGDADTRPSQAVASAAATSLRSASGSRKPVIRNTGDQLWDMAAQMKQMQGGSNGMDVDAINNNNNNANGMEGFASADMFANNAVALMKRHKRTDTLLDLSNHSTVMATPATRWKLVKKTLEHEGVEGLNSNHDLETGGDPTNSENSEDDNGKRRKRGGRMGQTKDSLTSEFHDFEEWLSFTKGNALSYMKHVLMYLILPSTAVACLLFYAVNNPPCGTEEECRDAQRDAMPTPAPISNSTDASESVRKFFTSTITNASVSWWLLFLGVRQVITFTLARASQAWLVDFLALRTRWFVKLVGPFFTLMIVQAKGWPLVLFFWGVYDFAFLYGDSEFARHWMFWQTAMDVFNESNPSGGITGERIYMLILACAIAVGVAVAIKRFWIGLFLGRQTFHNYADDLRKVMDRSILIGQVATLARDMEMYDFKIDDTNVEHSDAYNRALDEFGEDGASGENSNNAGPTPAKSASLARGLADNNDGEGTFAGAHLTGSIRMRINEVLGDWEEPETNDHKNELIHISSIIQFRQSLSCLNASFPFSVAFGPADTREACIASTEKVYNRLLASQSDQRCLHFNAIALTAMRPDGGLDEEKLTKIVRLFRPDRQGNLSLLDFAKSIDTVYKDLRLLRASVQNSSRTDKAFERIINIVFFFILGCIVLSIVGVDPFVLFASVSGFILGFAFMIGAACSKYFEGLLLILVRKPYNIGDRINVQDVNGETNFTGSSGWVVKDVTLFHTTIVFGSTNEVATVSNGSMASSRIINHTRSPEAALWFLMKFPIDTPFEKFSVFKGALEKFIQARPREWLSFAGFRNSSVDVEHAYVEYVVIGVHRESWQNIGALNSSLADLQSFALEISKKLNMRYRAPPLPIEMNMMQGNVSSVMNAAADDMVARDVFSQQSATTEALDEVQAMFDKAK